jgi:hypothetical protein
MASSYSPSPSKVEAALIKKNLRMRFNTLYGCHEVYTTIHGSGVFKWMTVSDETADWYREQFGLKIDTYLQPSLRTGGIVESSAISGTNRDVYDKG